MSTDPGGVTLLALQSTAPESCSCPHLQAIAVLGYLPCTSQAHRAGISPSAKQRSAAEASLLQDPLGQGGGKGFAEGLQQTL